MTDTPDRLKPVGGFAEVVGHFIPDLSLSPEEDLSASPAWQATIYIQFSDNNRLIAGLSKTIKDKLKGRLPASSVDKDVTDNCYLLAHFLVADNSELAEDMVDSFADGIIEAISEVTVVHDSQTDIDFVGEEKEGLFELL